MDYPEQQNQSFTNHLVWILFVRQFFFTTALNFLFLFIAFLSVMFWAEHCVTKAVTLVEQYGLPSPDALVWMEMNDYTILPLDRPAEGTHSKNIFKTY